MDNPSGNWRGEGIEQERNTNGIKFEKGKIIKKKKPTKN